MQEGADVGYAFAHEQGLYGVEADDEEGGADANAHAGQVRADVGDEAEEDVHGKCEV